MSRIAATRVVARVEHAESPVSAMFTNHPRWWITVYRGPSDTMRQPDITVDVDTPIAMVIDSGGPKPTAIGTA
jgi:hypothetical protein